MFFNALLSWVKKSSWVGAGQFRGVFGMKLALPICVVETFARDAKRRPLPRREGSWNPLMLEVTAMGPRKVKLGEDGQALLEFALTFPILLTLVTLIMQFALVFNGTALVRYAAYNAARSAAVHLPLNGNNGGDSAVQSKARMAAAWSMAPVSPRASGGIFGGLPGNIGNIGGLDIADRLLYAWGILTMTDGVKVQRAGDFGSGSNSSGWSVREPVYVTVDFYFALLIPPADRVLWYFGGSAKDFTSILLYYATGGKLKTLDMKGKAVFLHTGVDCGEKSSGACNGGRG